jgi:hypothetical protein
MKYFKVFNEEDKHHDFQYHDGINIDSNFIDETDYDNGMFFTTRENIHEFYGYGDYIREVIPLGKIVTVGNKFKTDKLKLKERYWLGDLNTYDKFKIPLLDMDLASEKGYISILDEWKNSGSEFVYSIDSMDLASFNGHISVLQWWKENVNELKYTTGSMDWPSRNGHIDTLKWWKDSKLNLKYSVNAMKWALQNNQVDVVKWWKESGLLEE